MAEETAEQLDVKIATLRDAIDGGALSVEYPDGGRVTYRSLDQMRSVLSSLQARLSVVSGSTRVRVARVVASTKSGY